MYMHIADQPHHWNDNYSSVLVIAEGITLPAKKTFPDKPRQLVRTVQLEVIFLRFPCNYYRQYIDNRSKAVPT